jgi:hypothetical protein
VSETAPRSAPLADVSYLALCSVLGLAAGWIPVFLHGPIVEKFNVLYIDGRIAVWGFYAARCSIGLWIGLTVLPRQWYLRGPLCGLLALLPLTIVSLAMPGCGFT